MADEYFGNTLDNPYEGEMERSRATGQMVLQGGDGGPLSELAHVTVSGNSGCMLSTSAQKKLKRTKLIFLLLHLYSFPSACLFHFFHSPTMSSGQKGTKEVH